MQLDPSQQRAVALICTAPVAIVTGGAGVGKTTCLRVALDRLEGELARVRLAATTGKAARRMSEATGRASETVHKLLGVGGFGPGGRTIFLHNEDNPIDADLVVVDECSMLDTELASAFFSAVQPPTRLVLIGDANQLPSVGPGRVFSDLIESGHVPVARLTTLHRAAAESWVCSQAPEILAGRAPDLHERPDFWFVEREGRDDAIEALVQVVCAGLPNLGVPRDSIQAIVPQNVGPAGADALNARLQALLNLEPEGTGWKLSDGVEVRVGDRVIQTRNNYQLGVMNGEIGTVIGLDREEMGVRFDGADDVPHVTYTREPAFDLRLAYALTAHKLQGSETPWAVVLVHSTHTRMITRQWLYTAVTRARKGVVIVGDRLGLERAVRNVADLRRNTSLVERLQQAIDRGSAGEGEMA